MAAITPELEVAGRQLEVEADSAQTLPTVKGDPGRLELALLNLLRNAIDANREHYPEHASQVQLRIVAQDGQVCIDVIDQGAGVSAEAREQLFVPFYTSKADGLGLGLSMSQGIVEGCGGSLDALPAESGGLCLRCLLPAASN